MSDKQIVPVQTASVSKDMQMLYGFFNKNTLMLKDIYVQHRVDEGIGLLSLFLVKKGKTYDVKVGYMKREVLPEELKIDLDTRVKNNTTKIENKIKQLGDKILNTTLKEINSHII